DDVAEMKIGRGGIESGFYPQRLARGDVLLQLGAKLRLLHDFSGAFFDVGELFVNGRERGHRVKIIAASRSHHRSRRPGRLVRVDERSGSLLLGCRNRADNAELRSAGRRTAFAPTWFVPTL